MKKLLLIAIVLHLAHTAFCQRADTLQTPSFFSGIVTATNNGISLLPNFSLNKPAALFDLSMGKGRLSFDPMFRFSMEGKPWTFIFWGRYKLINRPKFKMSIGAHPSFVFRTITATVNGGANDYLTAQRYFAWEAAPTYPINKKTSVGIYYLGSHGLTKDLTQYTTFLAARAILSNIELPKRFKLTLIPQFYYLKQDTKAGTYLNATVILSKKNSPFSISAIASKAMNTTIPGKNLIWNIGLNYNFNKQYYPSSPYSVHKQ